MTRQEAWLTHTIPTTSYAASPILEQQINVRILTNRREKIRDVPPIASTEHPDG